MIDGSGSDPFKSYPSRHSSTKETKQPEKGKKGKSSKTHGDHSKAKVVAVEVLRGDETAGQSVREKKSLGSHKKTKHSKEKHPSAHAVAERSLPQKKELKEDLLKSQVIRRPKSLHETHNEADRLKPAKEKEEAPLKVHSKKPKGAEKKEGLSKSKKRKPKPVSSSSMFFDEIKPNLRIYNNEKYLRECLGNKWSSEKLQNEVLELIEKTPQDRIGQNWQNYVIFKDSKVAKSMDYDPDQERYGNWMHHTVKIATTGLREKQWSFQEVLQFLCSSRQYIASDSRYGYERNNTGETYFYEGSPYIAVYNFYKNYLPDGKVCRLKKFEGGKKFIHVANLDQHEIKLSKILPSENPVSAFGRTCFGFMYHTSPKKIDKIMTFVETKLYPEALQEDNKEELIKKLGRIFWWICQAKPWLLGDPSIAEMLIRTIWASKGFEPPAWKEGIIPWVEVTNEPDVDRFAENFHALFK